MRRLLVIALLLLLPSSAWATAYTASGTTCHWNASSGGNFTGGTGGVPGSGDTINVPSGTTLFVDDGYAAVIGTSGATGTAAITITAGGFMQIGQTNGAMSPATLQLQGDLIAHGKAASFPTTPTVTMLAGTSITFLCPASTQYKIDCSPSSGGFYSTLSCQGTSGARCAITSNLTNGATSTGWVHTDGTSNYQGLINATYTDFSNLNDQINTTSSQGMAQTTAIVSNAAATVTFQNCTFNNCGKNQINMNGNAAGNLTYTGNVWGNTTPNVGSQVSGITNQNVGLDLRINNAATGTRTMTGNCFDMVVNCPGSTSITCTGNYFGYGGNLTAAGPDWAQFDSNAIVLRQLNNWTAIGNVTNCWVSSAWEGNCKYLVPGTLAGTFNITGNICEHSHPSDGNGDCYEMNVAANVVWTMRNNFVMPDFWGNNSGVLFTGSIPNTQTGSTVSIEHNTVYGSPQQFTADLGETNAGYTGAVTSFRGNLAWSPVSISPVMLNEQSGGAQDYVSAANANYNGNWNLALSSGGSFYTTVNGYALNLSTGTPGANDVKNTNPQFVDSTRSMPLWSGYLVAQGLYTPSSNKGAWASGTSYNVGDVVQSTVSNVAFGKPVYYICRAAHTSTTGNTSGSGDSQTQQPGLNGYQRITASGALVTSGSFGSANVETSISGVSMANPKFNINWNDTIATVVTAINGTGINGKGVYCYAGGNGANTNGPLSSGNDLYFYFTNNSSAGAGSVVTNCRVMWQNVPALVGGSVNNNFGVKNLDWHTNWELLSLYILRTAGANTITDSSLGLTGVPYIKHMMTWERAGFRPQNTAYKGASYPGDASTTDANGNTWAGGSTPDIGAMAVLSSANPAAILLNAMRGPEGLDIFHTDALRR